MKVGQLIDIAIGFPEPGHVNFSALHCLLICITRKLGMADDIVDYYTNETETICCKELPNNDRRLIAGSNPADENASETPPQAEASALEKSHNADVTTEKDLENDSVEQTEGASSDILIESPSKEKHEKENADLSPEKEERVTKAEMTMRKIEVSKEILSGISVMKDQLEFVIEQMLLLTFLTLSKKPDFNQIQQLYSMAQTLLEIKKDNTFIEGCKHIKLPSIPPLNWQSSGLQLNKDLAENDILEIQSIGSARGTTEAETTHHDDLDDHLCYSPSKLLDQLMKLKSDVCLLANKVNELTSRLLQQESQRTLALIQDMQEQMRDVKLTIGSLKENQSHTEQRLTSNQSNIENIKRNIEEILEEKVDKTHFEMQLANKVDYNQLHRKVSLDQILELQCRIDKKFCEILRQINESDKKFSETVEHLRNTLGFAAIDEVLAKFKENISKDIQALHELLKNYIELTNDDSAAAGSRTKVLHHLACLSCDTNCVMRTMEKAKVAKLPSAHASNIISPLITYELGSIRKSGIMGYYRKDEFPHATNAWLAHQSNALTNIKQCVPRHAGGQHTTNNAKERIQKTTIQGK